MGALVPSKPVYGDRSNSGHHTACNKADSAKAPVGAQGVQTLPQPAMNIMPQTDARPGPTI